MSRCLSRCLGVASLWVLAGTAQAAPFQNGSFELPGLGSSLFQPINVQSQAPTGWTVGGNLTGVALFLQQTGAFAGVVAQAGTHLLGFGGNSATGATIEQVFDTVPGLSYTVSFFTTAQQLGNGPQSFSAQAFSTASGQPLLGSVSSSIPAVNSWVNHSFAFVAAGSSSLLRFTDTSNGAAAASLNWALDNVTVTAVPEPATWALLLGGLAGLLRRVRQPQG